jgi:predicted membrane protein
MNMIYNRTVSGFIIVIIGILFILDAIVRHSIGFVLGILFLILGIYMIIATDENASMKTEVKK